MLEREQDRRHGDGEHLRVPRAATRAITPRKISSSAIAGRTATAISAVTQARLDGRCPQHLRIVVKRGTARRAAAADTSSAPPTSTPARMKRSGTRRRPSAPGIGRASAMIMIDGRHEAAARHHVDRRAHDAEHDLATARSPRSRAREPDRYGATRRCVIQRSRARLARDRARHRRGRRGRRHVRRAPATLGVARYTAARVAGGRRGACRRGRREAEAQARTAPATRVGARCRRGAEPATNPAGATPAAASRHADRPARAADRRPIARSSGAATTPRDRRRRSTWRTARVALARAMTRSARRSTASPARRRAA